MRKVCPAWDSMGVMNLDYMFAAVRHGPADPTFHRHMGVLWRAFNSPFGSVTMRLTRAQQSTDAQVLDSATQDPATRDSAIRHPAALDSAALGVTAYAWGPGANWAMEKLPSMLADQADATDFDPSSVATGAHSPRLRERAVRLSLQWRPAAVAPLVDHLVASVLEQRVTALEAHRSWAGLVHQFGHRAPGPSDMPPGLRVPPAPDQWRRIPSWQWHQVGVDPKRADTIMRAVSRIGEREPADAVESHIRSLASVAGIGVWTLALLRQAVLGDPDAVQFGDFHTCHDVVYALTGEHRASDERLAEVLAPWFGQRYRVVRLVELAGVSAPRRGPRLSPLDHRRW